MSGSTRLGALLGLGLVAALALPQSAFAFGALAVESNHSGGVGWAHNYPTKQDAEDKAMSECGDNCTVVLDFWNGCAAYAVDQDTSSFIYGWGTGESRRQAENSAENQCEGQGADSCTIKVWSCE